MGSGAELLTDSCEDVGEAEVVHRIEGEQVIEELLLLIITAQEGITLVQLPVRGKTSTHHSQPGRGEKLSVLISTSRWVRKQEMSSLKLLGNTV